MAVAIDRKLYETLPTLTEVDASKADIAWLIYDLELDKRLNLYQLVLKEKVCTLFRPALDLITMAESGSLEEFTDTIQRKLDKKLESEHNPPDAPTLADMI